MSTFHAGICLHGHVAVLFRVTWKDDYSYIGYSKLTTMVTYLLHAFGLSLYGWLTSPPILLFRHSDNEVHLFLTKVVLKLFPITVWNMTHYCKQISELQRRKTRMDTAYLIWGWLESYTTQRIFLGYPTPIVHSWSLVSMCHWGRPFYCY